MYTVLVPDNLHINKKNFSSFFKFIDREKIHVDFVNDRNDWIALYGNYISKQTVLKKKLGILKRLDEQQLFDFNARGINLFFISRAEILSLIIKEKEWSSTEFPESQYEIFNRMYKYNRKELLLNLAAAWDWIDFWWAYLQDRKVYSHCCIFSGSLIYQRSLIELMRYRSTRVFILESFFTGNDYYCEEKYEPIANNCDIKHEAIYNSLLKDLTINEESRETVKAINKVLLSKNKNVQQPIDGAPLSFSSKGVTVAILGQVVNDFSLLEYRGRGLSSIRFYQNIIEKLVQAGFNVIFKAHPWEHKKINVEGSFTKDAILKYTSKLNQQLQDRIIVVDDYPIKKLFQYSDYIVGLNSQGLLEAAFEGFKPVQFGNAFYGYKGFTSDYGLSEIDLFINDLLKENIKGALSLEEYKKYQKFLLKMMQGQLVSIHNSGVPKLCDKFKLMSNIKLAVKKSNKNLNTNKPMVVESISHNELVNIEKKVKLSSLQRKLLKFKKSPRKFFIDSKYFFIRWCHIFFPKK